MPSSLPKPATRSRNAEIPDCCYLSISIAGGPVRRVTIELFKEKVPQTCRNFAHLCQAPGRASAKTPVPTYRGCLFHRIVPGFMCQSGDFSNFDGTGGHAVAISGDSSIASSSRTFADESFEIQHDQPGIVSMANRGPNTNGSQFFITLAATPHLNGKHVAFGRVQEGMNVFHDMANSDMVELQGTRPTNMHKIVILDCGIGQATEPDEQTAEGEVDKRDKKKGEKKRQKHDKKHKKEHKHKQRRIHHSDSDDAYVDSDADKRGRKKRSKRKHTRHDSSSSSSAGSSSENFLRRKKSNKRRH